jgi:hypothetical protein
MTQPRVAKTRRSGSRKVTKPAGSAAAAPISPISRGEIERLAHSYWEARGCKGGSPEEDWLRAEEELKKRRAGTPT